MMARKWIVAGWITVVVAGVAWCLVIVGVGVSWRESQASTIPEGRTWVAWDIEFIATSLTYSPTIQIPDRDPVPATPGAVFVAVSVDFKRGSATEYPCSMSLVGDGRQWTRTNTFLVSEVIPGSRLYCNDTDDDGNPIKSGTIGNLYEIPASAIDEIRGVLITVMDPRQKLSDLPSLFKHPSSMALLEITPQ